MDRSELRALRERLGEAISERSDFCHTSGHHREDGTYVVERRGADSAGHRKVFDSVEDCKRTFESLPAEFTASDLDGAGVSGGRRHMLAWHYVEHPAFEAELVSRQPLTVRKSGQTGVDD